MPKQKRIRLNHTTRRINPMVELQAAHDGWKRALVSLGEMQDKLNDLKIELIKYRGY